MAESIVTFFLEKLTDLLSQEAFLLSRVEEQVKLLSNELEWMRLFLKDADAKRRYDPRIKLWVSQIRDVTYDAEDVIDRFMFEMNHQQQGSLKCLKFLKLRFVHKLESRIREINIKIEKIMANKSRYGVETLPAASSSNEVVPQKEKRVPIVEEVNVVGIREGAKSVKQMLLNGERRRAVVSIVGMGGLGKTTLAKKVYNDNDVQQYFDCHAWIYVSQENEAWDRLSLYVPDSMNGSRVLITSRNKEIGFHADPQTIPHELPFLTEEESWDLFLKKIFLAGSANAVCPRELEELGKKIVANCGGLPLAIVVLGGLLSRKEKTPLAWQKVLDSLTWHLNQGPDSCLGVLALSYNDMPYYLKSCFLYCGLFPEDSEIRTDKLIRLWVAEGFIQRRGKEIVEDGYESIDSTSPVSVRRLTIHQGKKTNSEHLHSSRLRSFICFSECFQENILRSLYRGVKLLTVLDLESMDIYTLPEGIGELIHLKYLCLRRTRIERLPSSIGHLINLQTLDFRGTLIEIIPSTIWKLHHLRHLYGHGLGKLTQLRELKIRWTEIPQIMCKGFSESFPNQIEFYPPNLIQLELEYCNIKQDPMVTLEKLPNLRILQLLYSSYMGKKMVCSSGGFQRLETLKLKGLKELRELIVEEGAVPDLKVSIIASYHKMARLPRGLLQLENLQYLELFQLSHKLIEEVNQTEGEDWDKIRLITSILQ
ncbi:unnamed protein product, partial [Vitis vinifera]